MGFQFREIKNYKKIMKEKEEIRLVSYIKERSNLLMKIEELENNYGLIQDKIRNLYNENFNISLINLYNENLSSINFDIVSKKKGLLEIENKIKEQRLVIKNSTIEFKKFEKLEEEYLLNKLERINYNEKKELDEITSIKEFHKKED